MPKRSRNGGTPMRQTRRRIGNNYMSSIRTNLSRRRYLAKQERQRRLGRARRQQNAWRLRHIGLAAAGRMRPTPLPAFKHNVRSTKPIYRTPRPRYAKNISNHVSAQLRRGTPGHSLKVKADRKKFTLSTKYSFRWRPSAGCSPDAPDWFDIYPNRLINNVHFTRTHASMQLGGKREGADDYDACQSVPGKVPFGYREVAQCYESCIVTGTKVVVNVEMPNNLTDFDEEYVMGMYYEKDGQFTANQFVSGNDLGTVGKYARTAAWASKNNAPFSNGGAKGDHLSLTDGVFDRNGETFTFLDYDKLPNVYKDMEDKVRPATGKPTELMNYSASRNPSSQTRCVKSFEFFYDIKTTGKNVSDLISETEPREVWKPSHDGILRPPKSSNQNCAGPYGHMFEKNTEQNYHAQDIDHHYHVVNMFSNDPSYSGTDANNVSIRNGFLEPSRGGILRFVLFKKTGSIAVRTTMGKLDINLDFSVLAFNKLFYDTERVVANMPLAHETCQNVSTILPPSAPLYVDTRGDMEIEQEEADDLRGIQNESMT